MASTPKYKVIIAESMAEDGINLLRYNTNFDVVVLDKKEKEKLEKEIKDAHAIVVRSGVKVKEELLQKAEKLEIVGRAGAGYDNIDVDACSKRGVVVMIAPAGNTNGVVELTIGLMFALVRHIPKADATMKNDVWAKKKLSGTELKGKSLGMIGLGKIGSRVAEIAHSLGMKVVALVNNKNKKRNLSFQIELVDTLEDILPYVDFLSLHVPLNEKTENLIDEKELNMMKPSAFIINTSRGAVINEKALYNVLKEGLIAGAAVDVYSEEPASKKDYPFIELDNVIAMPHLGASTKESQANVSRIICENIMEALENNIYIDAVNLPFSIPAELADIYAPFIKLAKDLGKLAGQYYNDKVKQIQMLYRMNQIKDLTPIVMSACAEILGPNFNDISLINVKEFLDKGDVSLIINKDPDLGLDNSLRLSLTYDDNKTFDVKGTLVAGIPKILEIKNIKLELVPTGKVIFIKNLNVPGVIGEIGTFFGEKKINIAEMHLGRSEIGGETRGAVLIDTEISKEILEELKDLENIVDVKLINFG